MLQIFFFLRFESFQMIANDVTKFLSFPLQLTIAGLTIFIKKTTRFVQDVLFYPINEVMVFL